MLALGVSAGLPAAAAAQPPLRIARQGKFFLVNGWVLTADDLRELQLRDP